MKKKCIFDLVGVNVDPDELSIRDSWAEAKKVRISAPGITSDIRALFNPEAVRGFKHWLCAIYWMPVIRGREATLVRFGSYRGTAPTLSSSPGEAATTKVSPS